MPGIRDRRINTGYEKNYCLLPSCSRGRAPSYSQLYQPNWESLDKRPTPQWFQDAKFGIFIHWGVYSVPGWSSKGNYAEWYQQGFKTTGQPASVFTKPKFGDRSYYDLANDFKAELYNPDEWAKLFEQSGAKYIVLTSKHHDGFVCGPAFRLNLTWGFPPGTRKTSAPGVTLLGDLFKAVRKTRCMPACTSHCTEWFNPYVETG